MILAALALAVFGLFYYFTGVKWFLASGGLTALTGCLITLAAIFHKRDGG
jgi:hypothetical protein